MTMTMREARAAYGIQAGQDAALDELVPVLTVLQFQGDVAIIPSRAPEAVTPIPPEGIDVVLGEAGTHAHTLIGEGYFDADGSVLRGLVRLGTLTVPDGATAYLAHEEHGYSGIGPGTYELRRQRELRATEAPITD